MIKIKLFFIFFFFIFLPNTISANGSNLLNNKIGIEIGSGHNVLLWPKTVGIKTPGAAAVDRNELYITPSIRINYTISISNKYGLMPFIGYNYLGGKLEGSTYSFKIIECGVFTQYNYERLSFGFGVKNNRNLDVQYHFPAFDEDRTDWFVNQWIDAGIRISYLINRFSISIEPWFGLNNLATGPIKGAKIYENHYRIMFCCRL